MRIFGLTILHNCLNGHPTDFGKLEFIIILNNSFFASIPGYKFDVTPIYDVSDKEGHNLLDLALNTKNSRQNVPAKTVEDFMKFIDGGVKERSVVVNGVAGVRKFYSCEMAAIMITKD